MSSLGTFAHVTIYYLTHTKLYGIKIFRQNIRFKGLSVIALCRVVKNQVFPFCGILTHPLSPLVGGQSRTQILPCKCNRNVTTAWPKKIWLRDSWKGTPTPTMGVSALGILPYTSLLIFSVILTNNGLVEYHEAFKCNVTWSMLLHRSTSIPVSSDDKSKSLQ